MIQNTARFIIVLMILNAYLHQMKLHNSGLCYYRGETEAVGHFLANVNVSYVRNMLSPVRLSSVCL